MVLPDSFTDQMRSLLGDEFDEFIKTYEKGANTCIRINNLKIPNDMFCGIAPYGIKKCAFCDNGFYVNNTDAWSKHPYYYAGLYYIQEPSAMLPAVVLSANPGDMVLDLCAAPGGKSTQLIQGRPRLLVSNDISFSRTIPLVKNIEMTGSQDVAVTCESPDKLSRLYPDTFDKILIDAPCSGEGMFRKDASLISSYTGKGPSYYEGTQKDILEHAYRMLKPGGKMLYSTCTFSDIEDEMVIQSILDAHEDLYIIDIDKSFGLSGPYDKYADDKRLSGIVHAFPHRFKGEGHFMALIGKRGDAPFSGKSRYSFSGYSQIKPLCEIASMLTGNAKDKFTSAGFLSTADGFIYMIPEGLYRIYDRSVRYVRTGVLVGKLQKSGKIIPSTAFALTVNAKEHNNVFNLSSDDPIITRYLKGETITGDINDLDKGYVLVCVDSYPLGFAKYDGSKLKNLYEKGWVQR